jgi:hypothetical protein
VVVATLCMNAESSDRELGGDRVSVLADVVTKAANPTGSENYAAAAGWFIFQWILLLGAATIHVIVDHRRHPEHRHGGRIAELYLVWILAFGGFWAILSGIGHISGQSEELAESIGYTQSMFQWEVGWADIGIGVLGIVCIKKRDAWMTAAVVMLAISYFGDAIGHIVQWAKHSNTEPDNVWAIPSDILGPLAAILLLLYVRRVAGATAGRTAVTRTAG